MTGKVVWHVTMSLDGFIAGRDDAMDWVFGFSSEISPMGRAARGRNLVLFGATIPRQALRLGLVDEFVIHLAPILVGDGIRLFGGEDASRVRLEKVEAVNAGQLTDLRLRVLDRTPSCA